VVYERGHPLNKVYQYPNQRRIFSIIIPTVLSGLIVIAMGVEVLTSSTTQYTFPFGLLALIIFLDHFVSLSHPEKVTLSDQDIVFSGFGRHHVYTFDKIKRINIRKTAFTKSIYVRINDASLFKGRYWLQIETLSEGKELQEFLTKLVEAKHPLFKNFDRRSFDRTK
jgi:hypothetical protein